MNLHRKKSIPRAGSPAGTAIWSIGLLASSFFIDLGRRHLRDVVEHRLNLALQKDSAGELIEINLQPRLIRLAASNRLKQIGWTIKGWAGVICIQIGHLLGFVASPHNSMLKGEKICLPCPRGNRDRFRGSESEKVCVCPKSGVDSHIVDVQRKVFCLIDDYYDDCHRTTTYRYTGSEWGSGLQKPKSPLHRSCDHGQP